MTLLNGRRYRLTRNVVNPSRDKRATDDCSRLPWTAGDVWRVDGDRLEPIHIAAAVHRPNGRLWGQEPGRAALDAALELLPESAVDIVCGAGLYDYNCDAVLNELMESGAVSRGAVEASAKAVYEAD